MAENFKGGIVMRFKYLGTAAAEGIPGLFCQCDVCKRAAAAGGRNIRGRSGAMLGDNILLDFPPDIFTYKVRYGLDLAKVTHIIMTHSHSDHLAANELIYYHHWFSTRDNLGSKLTLYGNESVLAAVHHALDTEINNLPDWLVLERITPFESITVGETVFTPLPANHSKKEECVFYLIEHKGRRMLYANDTGFFPEETMSWLAGKRLDIVSLDCTCGATKEGSNHMGFPDNLTVKDKLIGQGSADADTMFISHHFSHNGKINYDDFEALAKGSGFVSSWDGLEVEL
jgi:phosphoribosyl 1,2-cyclic phosphate phosphodiesterase